MAFDQKKLVGMCENLRIALQKEDSRWTDRELSEIRSIVHYLADTYLSCSPDECVAIRNAVFGRYPGEPAGKPRAGPWRKIVRFFWGGPLQQVNGPSRALLDYTVWACKQARDTGELAWLRRSLAALSIEDFYMDFRDSYLHMSDIWACASQLGADPTGDFEYVANRSGSKHAYLADCSVARSIREFKNSACGRSVIAGARGIEAGGIPEYQYLQRCDG